MKLLPSKYMKNCKILGLFGIIVFAVATAVTDAEISPADRPAHVTTEEIVS